MDITANELTQWAKKNLEFIGYRLNRVNNIPFAKRKGTIQKGWADLQGYTSQGIYVAVEIKKIGDKISKEQKERLDDIHKCGGIVYICTEVDKKATLIEWSKMKF
jgi:VRR-NUC domain